MVDVGETTRGLDIGGEQTRDIGGDTDQYQSEAYEWFLEHGDDLIAISAMASLGAGPDDEPMKPGLQNPESIKGVYAEDEGQDNFLLY